MKGIIGSFFFQFGVDDVGRRVALAARSPDARADALLAVSLDRQGDPARPKDGPLHGVACEVLPPRTGLCLERTSSRRARGSVADLRRSPCSSARPCKRNSCRRKIRDSFWRRSTRRSARRWSSPTRLFETAEKFLIDAPELADVYVAIGGFQGGLVNQGNMFVTLKDLSERAVCIAPFKHDADAAGIHGVRARLASARSRASRARRSSILSLAGFTSQRGYPITFSVQGPGLGKDRRYRQRMMDKMTQSGLMTDVDSNYNPDMPEIKIYPGPLQGGASRRERHSHRQRPSARWSAVSRSANTPTNSGIATTCGSNCSTSITTAQKTSIASGFATTTARWSRCKPGEARRKGLASDDQPLQPRTRGHRFREYLARQSRKMTRWTSSRKTAKKFLPHGYHIEISGSSQAFKESFQSLFVALILGNFRRLYGSWAPSSTRFIHPFTVLLALPFSVTGAFLALRLTGTSLNIYSMIGILLLMGIVKKNSIFLVDFHQSAPHAKA